jgi:hypothetical protein
MRMRGRGGLGCRCGQGEVIDRRRTTDVGVGNKSKITECRQRAIDRGR